MGGINLISFNVLPHLRIVATCWNQPKFTDALSDAGRARDGLSQIAFGPSSRLHTPSLKLFGTEHAMCSQLDYKPLMCDSPRPISPSGWREDMRSPTRPLILAELWFPSVEAISSIQTNDLQILCRAYFTEEEVSRYVPHSDGLASLRHPSKVG